MLKFCISELMIVCAIISIMILVNSRIGDRGHLTYQNRSYVFYEYGWPCYFFAYVVESYENEDVGQFSQRYYEVRFRFGKLAENLCFWLFAIIFIVFSFRQLKKGQKGQASLIDSTR